MHDPLFLLYEVPVIELDIWHREPDGRDSGEVCGHAPNRGPARLAWAVRHIRHHRYRWWPWLHVHRWITHRCAGCGRRFRWREARHGYQSSDQVWHDPCMSLRHVRGQLDDITGYVRGEADSNARWRVEYRLKNLDRT